jgi:hypothetical protein
MGVTFVPAARNHYRVAAGHELALLTSLVKTLQHMCHPESPRFWRVRDLLFAFARRIASMSTEPDKI